MAVVKAPMPVMNLYPSKYPQAPAPVCLNDDLKAFSALKIFLSCVHMVQVKNKIGKYVYKARVSLKLNRYEDK